MESIEIYGKLTEVFRSVFGDDEINISPELTADDVDGWDSLKHVRLLLTIERAFSIKFAAADVTRLKNVGELADLIKRKI